MENTDILKCTRCNKVLEDDYSADMENCPKEIWNLYKGDVQDIDLAWQDEWGYICNECKYPPSKYQGDPSAKRAYLEARDLCDPFSGPPEMCPECGFVFKAGWSRFKQHWSAKHSNIEPYSESLLTRIRRYEYFEQ